MFPNALWNCFESTKAGNSKTTNSLEAWHNALKLALGSSDGKKPKFLKWLRQMKKECSLKEAELAKQQQLLQLQQQRQYAAALAARQSAGSLPGRLMQNMKGGGNSNNFSPNNRSQQAGQLSQMLKNTNGGGTPSTVTPQMIQAAMQQQLRQQQMAQQAMAAKQAGLKASAASALQKQMPPKERPTTQFKNSLASNFSTMPASPTPNGPICEICDLQQLKGKTHADMVQGAPLACSRCRDRFWTYEGLERHLVMGHGLVTSDLLTKAQKKEDGGKCKLCGKQYAFNMLQHLVSDHQVKLCSAEIMYSCDVCEFKCSSYQSITGKGKSLSDVEQGKILAFHKSGRSNRNIAEELKRSSDVIDRFVKNPQQYGRKKHTGSKPKISPRMQRRIISRSSNSTMSINQIRADLGLLFDVHLFVNKRDMYFTAFSHADLPTSYREQMRKVRTQLADKEDDLKSAENINLFAGLLDVKWCADLILSFSDT
uniref:C2H2-type domain-containing protein n=1 Tax=Ditylenchus dipsaci TaxID=166011 RepID=A0A915D399_9BILA